MNRKTVHRAYRRLAREGLLDLRPGSGSFIADEVPDELNRTPLGELVLSANRVRAAAAGVGLEPDVFASFLEAFLNGGLRDVPLVVAECNREQLGLMEEELRAALGVAPKPVLLSQLAAAPARSLRGCLGVVTTDCHRREVVEVLRPLDVPVHRVAFDPRFPQALVEQAEQRPMVFVVSDSRFVPVFRRMLRQLTSDEALLERFHIVEPAEAGDLLRTIHEPAAVCFSPLVDGESVRLPTRFRRVRGRWRLDQHSVERVRAALALDLVLRRFDRGTVEPSCRPLAG
jgi:hypothetical protein